LFQTRFNTSFVYLTLYFSTLAAIVAPWDFLLESKQERNYYCTGGARIQKTEVLLDWGHKVQLLQTPNNTSTCCSSLLACLLSLCLSFFLACFLLCLCLSVLSPSSRFLYRLCKNCLLPILDLSIDLCRHFCSAFRVSSSASRKAATAQKLGATTTTVVLCKLRQQFPQRERSSEWKWVECKANAFLCFFLRLEGAGEVVCGRQSTYKYCSVVVPFQLWPIA
jgi:hypothetical protein